MAYIAELKRLFRDLGELPAFASVDAHGGRPENVKAALLKIRRDCGRDVTAIALLDEDIYHRGEADCNALPAQIDCKFNKWNFEDFLALHCSDDLLDLWLEDCRESGHLYNPRAGCEVTARLRHTLFPGYRHGHLPKNFAVSKESLQNLIRHSDNANIPLSSDFAAFLKDLLANSWSREDW